MKDSIERTPLGKAPRILVVDDEQDLCELLELTLVGMGLDVDIANDVQTARRLIEERRYSLCLTDMKLPDGSGLDLVARISLLRNAYPVAVLTAFGSAETAVIAFKAGAFDYLSKPVALDALRTLVRSALKGESSQVVASDAFAGAARHGDARDSAERTAAARAPATRDDAGSGNNAAGALAHALTGRGSGRGAGAREPREDRLLLGVSPAIGVVRETILRMARSMAPVAISGESGSGKELAARSIHRCSPRVDGPFVAVNCGAIPETLMESEFFGYRKGAFTGADADRNGFFMAADGGTLFLDEVAELPLAMQVKLLRAIQEKRVRKVGAVQEESVDVRIVSATHQDLARCVREGRFRQDLYYRLNVIELRMPALRERPEDIDLIAGNVLARVSARAGLDTVPQLSSMALRFLRGYDFPGNVRELENILERAVAFSDGHTINVEDLGLRPVQGRSGDAVRRSDVVPSSDADRRSDVMRSAAAGPGSFGDVPSLAAGREPNATLPVAGGAVTAVGPAVDESTMGSADQQLADAALVAVAFSGEVPASLTEYLDAIERDAIRRALLQTGQNRTAAARLLGVTFRTLRYRMQKLDMRGPEAAAAGEER